MQLLFRKEIIMYLDFHAHFDSIDPVLIRTFIQNSEQNQTVTVFSGGNMGGNCYAPNEEVLRLCRKYAPWFMPAAKIDLWDNAVDLGEIRRLKDKGVIALKCIYPWYEYDHDLYMPFYEEAEKLNLPILFHTGDYRPHETDRQFRRPFLRNMLPLTLDRIARSFPELPIVMAHLGTTYYRTEAAELIKTHANLYADLGGCGSWLALSAEELRDLLCHRLYKRDASGKYFGKLVFGSDCYITRPDVQTRALQCYRHLLLMNDISEEIIAQVMGETVKKWIHLS